MTDFYERLLGITDFVHHSTLYYFYNHASHKDEVFISIPWSF